MDGRWGGEGTKSQLQSVLTDFFLPQISEAMDGLMKQGLRSFSQRKGGEQINIPSISLKLLHSISKLDFPTQRLRTNFIKRHVRFLFYWDLATSINFFSKHASEDMHFSRSHMLFGCLMTV